MLIFIFYSDAGADCLAFETIGCAREAAVIVAVLQGAPGVAPYAPAWVSFTCSGGDTLVSGEALSAVIALLLRFDESHAITAVGVNCLNPDVTSAAVSTVLQAVATSNRNILVVCYPNTGQTWDPSLGDWVAGTGLDDTEFAAKCVEWKQSGVHALGGCCQTTPNTIRAVATALGRSEVRGER